MSSSLRRENAWEKQPNHSPSITSVDTKEGAKQLPFLGESMFSWRAPPKDCKSAWRSGQPDATRPKLSLGSHPPKKQKKSNNKERKKAKGVARSPHVCSGLGDGRAAHFAVVFHLELQNTPLLYRQFRGIGGSRARSASHSLQSKRLQIQLAVQTSGPGYVSTARRGGRPRDEICLQQKLCY